MEAAKHKRVYLAIFPTSEFKKFTLEEVVKDPEEFYRIIRIVFGLKENSTFTFRSTKHFDTILLLNTLQDSRKYHVCLGDPTEVKRVLPRISLELRIPSQPSRSFWQSAEATPNPEKTSKVKEGHTVRQYLSFESTMECTFKRERLDSRSPYGALQITISTNNSIQQPLNLSNKYFVSNVEVSCFDVSDSRGHLTFLNHGSDVSYQPPTGQDGSYSTTHERITYERSQHHDRYPWFEDSIKFNEMNTFMTSLNKFNGKKKFSFREKTQEKVTNIPNESLSSVNRTHEITYQLSEGKRQEATIGIIGRVFGRKCKEESHKSQSEILKRKLKSGEEMEASVGKSFEFESMKYHRVNYAQLFMFRISWSSTDSHVTVERIRSTPQYESWYSGELKPTYTGSSRDADMILNNNCFWKWRDSVNGVLRLESPSRAPTLPLQNSGPFLMPPRQPSGEVPIVKSSAPLAPLRSDSISVEEPRPSRTRDRTSDAIPGQPKKAPRPLQDESRRPPILPSLSQSVFHRDRETEESRVPRARRRTLSGGEMSPVVEIDIPDSNESYRSSEFPEVLRESIERGKIEEAAQVSSKPAEKENPELKPDESIERETKELEDVVQLRHRKLGPSVSHDAANRGSLRFLQQQARLIQQENFKEMMSSSKTQYTKSPTSSFQSLSPGLSLEYTPVRGSSSRAMTLRDLEKATSVESAEPLPSTKTTIKDDFAKLNLDSIYKSGSFML